MINMGHKKRVKEDISDYLPCQASVIGLKIIIADLKVVLASTLRHPQVQNKQTSRFYK